MAKQTKKIGDIKDATAAQVIPTTQETVTKTKVKTTDLKVEEKETIKTPLPEDKSSVTQGDDIVIDREQSQVSALASMINQFTIDFPPTMAGRRKILSLPYIDKLRSLGLLNIIICESFPVLEERSESTIEEENKIDNFIKILWSIFTGANDLSVDITNLKVTTQDVNNPVDTLGIERAKYKDVNP